MDPIEAKNRQLLADLAAGKKPFDEVIEPGDENKPADNNLMNYAMQKMGVPQEYMVSAKAHKEGLNNMAQNMGMGAMGTIGKVGGVAEGALAKLMGAKQLGQKMSAAEEYLLSKATGNVPVVKTAQEMAEPIFGKIKGLMGK